MPGYYGCGDCFVCRVSIFGDKFKVNNSGSWFKIKGFIVLFNFNTVFITEVSHM